MNPRHADNQTAADYKAKALKYKRPNYSFNCSPMQHSHAVSSETETHKAETKADRSSHLFDTHKDL